MEAGATGLGVVRPPGWADPIGYADAITAADRFVFVAGQVGWNPVTQRVETDDFAEQVRQALLNIETVLRTAGTDSAHVVRLTWYVTDRDAYMSARIEIGRAYREVFGRHFPAMSLVLVAGLIEEGAKVEIEATAVIP